MTNSEDLLDEDALAANRLDHRRAIVISVVSFAAVLAASALIVLTGIPGS